MSRWVLVAVAYTALAVGALGIRWRWLEIAPLTDPEPWMPLGTLAHLYSGVLGLALGACLILLTRGSVKRYGWATRLHAELRPLTTGMAPAGIWLLAAVSSVGEELLFRGVLQPVVGLLPQALLFGLVHQLPGKSRWVWVLWAGVVGLALGLLFQLTGSLVGPILAHALVNAMNLRYLQTYDPAPPVRAMGGLLNQRS